MNEEMKKEIEALLTLNLTPGEMMVRLILESYAEKYNLKDTKLFWKLLTREIQITEEVNNEICKAIKFEKGYCSTLQKFYNEAVEKQNTIIC